MSTDKNHMTEKIYCPDLSHFLLNLKKHLGGIFSPKRDIYITRTPGQLEILGGLVESAGALVLQQTLHQSIIIAAQKRTDRRILIRNLNLDPERILTEEFHLDDLFQNANPKSFSKLQQEFALLGENNWIAHIIGLLAILMSRGFINMIESGANIAIQSSLPIGGGVGSSAALQVGTLIALQQIYNFQIDEYQLAEICQQLENEIIGHPRGKIQALACALGQSDQLMACLCQPHEINHREEWPTDVRIIGFDSGVRKPIHSHKLDDCQNTLCMAKRVFLQEMQKAKIPPPHGGYLVNINPEDWSSHLRNMIPYRLHGKDYKTKYHSRNIQKNFIDPEKRYNIRNLCEHAIMENDRSLRFLDLLETYRSTNDKSKLVEMGELLYQSHQSMVKNCGLHCKETDLIVEMIHALGPEKGFYGARSTSCSGGIVTLLTASNVEDALKNLAAQYHAKSGYIPSLLLGSSPGTLVTGIITTNFD